MKIIVKLTLAFLMISMLVLIVGYAASNRSQEILQEAIEENSMTISRSLMDRVDKNLYLLVNKVLLYTHEVAQKDLIHRSNEEFDNMADAEGYIWRMNEDWVSTPAYETTPFMKDIFENSLSQDLAFALELVQKEKAYGFKTFSEIFITNKYGANVAQTGRTSDYKQDDEEWWQIAKIEGIYVSDVEYDESSGIYSVSICSRIDDTKGEFLGVVKFVADLRYILDDLIYFSEMTKGGGADRLLKYTDYKTLHLNMINKDDRILYSTGSYKILDKITWEAYYAFKARITNNEMPDTFCDIYRHELKKGGEVFVVYALSRGYKDYEGMGWMLIMHIDTNEIFAPIAALRYKLLILSLFSAIFAIILGLAVAWSIYNPISKLKDAMVEIGKGRLDAPINIDTKDEIEDLAHSFQDMVYSIKDKQDQLMMAKSELEKWSQTLEKKVEEKTRELRETQGQLIQAEKLEAIGRIASGVAHEVKNPLGIILQAVNYFEMNIPKDQTQLHELLIMMKENIARAHNIIKSLSDFSKSYALQLTPQDINSIIDKSLILISHRARFESIDIIKEYSDKLPKAFADTGKLEQVLINVFLNAIYAMGKGGRLTIRTHACCIEKGQFNIGVKPRYDTCLVAGEKAVVIEVEDGGSGMDPDTLARVFDPFFTTKDQTEGTGLGLSVSKSIIEMHHGFIEIKSEKGKGTKVTIALKAVE